MSRYSWIAAWAANVQEASTREDSFELEELSTKEDPPAFYDYTIENAYKVSLNIYESVY